eukprot:4166319-Amphidinium_carterae.1
MRKRSSSSRSTLPGGETALRSSTRWSTPPGGGDTEGPGGDAAHPNEHPPSGGDCMLVPTSRHLPL